MLILGFLRSSAPFLAVGPIPPVTARSKRKQQSEDDNDADEVDDDGLGQLPINSNTGKRGTLLITLRNVVPYTKWCAFYYCHWLFPLNIGFLQGCPTTGKETSRTYFSEYKAESGLHSPTILCIQSADVEWL